MDPKKIYDSAALQYNLNLKRKHMCVTFSWKATHSRLFGQCNSSSWTGRKRYKVEWVGKVVNFSWEKRGQYDQNTLYKIV